MYRLSLLQILRKKLPLLIFFHFLVCSSSAHLIDTAQASSGSDGAWAPYVYIIEPPPSAGGAASATPPPGNQNNITLVFVAGMIVCVAIFSVTYFIAYRTIFVTRGEWNRNYTYRAHGRNMGAQQGHRSEEEGGGGLAASLLSSFPIIQYSSARAMAMKGAQEVSCGAENTVLMKECAVCLSEFVEGEDMKLLPVCGHSFHKACIDMWLFCHTTCPICRLSLLVKQTEKYPADRALPSASTDPPHELRVGVDI